jgi:uncharacterized membrane protein
MKTAALVRPLSLLAFSGLFGCAGTINTKNEVLVQRPRQEVFSYLANFENMPRWNYYVLDVSRPTPGPTRLGTTFHQTRKSDAQTYTVTEFAPEQAIAVTTVAPSRALTLRFVVADAPGGTRVTETWALDAGAAAVAGPIVAWRIESAVDKNLRVLRELLENGHAVLPDGRETAR